jgi:mercuric ion binding protein
MRLQFKSLILAFGIFPLLVLQANAQEKLVVRVDGLSCAYCAYSLEKALQKIDGVDKININLKEGTATLTLKEGVSIKDEVIEKTVKDSGFTPRSVKRQDESKHKNE